jgi:hypothetical protein
MGKAMESIGKTLFPVERRRHKRYELSLALAYQWRAEKDTLRTVDVSMGGIKVRTDTPFPTDESFNLIILLGNAVIKPIGKVVRSQQVSKGMYDVGIRFESISPQYVSSLEQFLLGITLNGYQRECHKPPEQSGLKASPSKPFESDRLRGNFLTWLSTSYPVDYQRYADRTEIGENLIRDFLKRKGIDNLNAYYLLRSLRGG